jgi:nucleoside-triphosphatase
MILGVLDFCLRRESLLKKRLLLVTGSPGSGKTTVLLKTIEALKARGHSVGGMISREVRTYETRVGFEVLDLSNGRRGWLAHVNQKQGPRVGKYRVNLEDLNNIGARAIAKAIENFDMIAVDEIGPMELHSEEFKDAVKRAVESGKLVIGTVHWKARDKFIDEVKAREDAEMFRVTYENRGNLHEIIVERAAEFLTKVAEE